MHDAPPVPPESDARLMRPWRLATIVYGVVLTMGTHWPNLAFGEEMPASDKTTHLLAFAVLTVLLARTGWFASPWRAAAVAAGWSVLDELTQALPGLNRTVGVPDIVANLLGCLLAGSWVTAMGPVGGAPSRWRHAMLGTTLDRVFGRWRVWILAAAMMLLTGGAYVAMRRFDPPLPAIGDLGRGEFERGIVLVVAIIAAHVGILMTMRWWQQSIDRAREHGLCVSCGRDRPELVPADAADGGLVLPQPGTCPDCGRIAWAVAWLQSSPMRPAAMMRVALRPAIGVAVTFGIAFTVVFVTPYALRGASGTPLQGTADAVLRWLRAVPETLSTPIDVTLAGLVLAAGTWWTRRAMAAAFDRPRTCRACGQDLRATPTRTGVGRCPECGEAFLRVDGDPA